MSEPVRCETCNLEFKDIAYYKNIWEQVDIFYGHQTTLT